MRPAISSHRVLVKGDEQRIWAYDDGVDLGGPALARIFRARRSDPMVPPLAPDQARGWRAKPWGDSGWWSIGHLAAVRTWLGSLLDLSA